MSDVDRLAAMFESGKLLHPVSDVPSLVDFSRVVSASYRGERPEVTPKSAQISEAIGEAEHLVFVLLDGFGMNFVEAMDGDAFIPGHVALEMRTVFPSTTPTALTSLATGRWPGEHAISGWHTFLPQIDDVSTIIRFQRASDEKALSELGVTPDSAYPAPSIFAEPSIEAHFIMPEEIAGTPYSQYWNGGHKSIGYKELADGFAEAAKQVNAASSPGFTYLYVPHVDRSAHECGAGHEKTWQKVVEVDRLMEELASALPNAARLIMTADHGHLDAEPDTSYAIASLDDELLKFSSRKPSGDIRTMYLSVEDGRLPEFKELFTERYGDDFLLLTTAEAEALGLFGPQPLSENMRARLGNIMSLSTGAATLDFRQAIETQDKDKKPAKSHHSGLTPAEMRIPLLIA